ncbi:MAG TPA: hypothetical protein EYP39_03940 [Ghiorsea sp.]|nr:hypothetical protein [Ghiorsea sp.]
MGIIPTALLGVLFPAFATVLASDRKKIANYFQKAGVYLLVILFPVVLLIALFSSEILLFWIGPEYASNSAVVMMILLLGVFINSFARLPYTLIQSDGRPDITAKLHLMELIPYMAGLWLCVHYFGVVGAAVIWVIRIIVDMLVLYYILYYRELIASSIILKNMMMVYISSFIMIAGMFISGVGYKLSFYLMVVLLFVLLIWRFVLMDDDKRHIIDFSKLAALKIGVR